MKATSSGLWPSIYLIRCIGAVFIMSWMAYGASPCGQPGVIFCNGFEGNTAEVNSAWENNTASNYSIVDPGPFNVSGNKVLSLNSEIMTHVRRGLGAGYDRVYARWYQKFPVGYVWSFSHHHGFTYSSSTTSGASAYVPWGCPTDPDIGTIADIWVQLEPNQNPGNNLEWYAYHPGKATGWGDIIGPYPWQPDNPPEVFPQGSISTGRWYCIETMIDLGTPTQTASGANGKLHTWLDGVDMGTDSCTSWPAQCGGIWFRSCSDLKIRYIDFMSSAPGHAGDQNSILYDDVVISTQPIGHGTRVPYFQVPLAITNSVLTAGTVNVPYSTFLSASGGAKDYTWQHVSGTLPPGLTFSLIGGLRGTPTQAGTFSFTVKVIDKSVPVQTTEKLLSITIKPSTGMVDARNSAVLSGLTKQVRANKLLLSFPALNTVGTVQLLDALGQTVWEQEVKQGAVSVESPALPNGLYVGRIGNGAGSAAFRFAVLR